MFFCEKEDEVCVVFSDVCVRELESGELSGCISKLGKELRLAHSASLSVGQTVRRVKKGSSKNWSFYILC